MIQAYLRHSLPLVGRVLENLMLQHLGVLVEKQEVLSGIVVEVGPGIPLGNPEENLDEPWSSNDGGSVKYIPPQAEVGDMALFVNKASIEVKIENEDYLIMPQSAILILIRDDLHSLAD